MVATISISIDLACRIDQALEPNPFKEGSKQWVDEEYRKHKVREELANIRVEAQRELL